MATPELAIAKATLSATLFRADPSSLTRPAVDAFFPLVSSTLSQCSRPNVQKCKAWIIDHVSPSSARSAALVKFLTAQSRSLQDEDQKPSLKRRRLHLLYLVNDVLHHVVKRNGDAKFATLWEDALPGLVANAAAFDNCPKHKKKLENLVDLWEEMQYFVPDLISQLRHSITHGAVLHATAAPQSLTTTTATSLKLAKDMPYTLPSFHGDPKMAWHDLPAATWLPHLTPNSSKPMLPDLIKPIQLAPGPADQVLVTAVKSLLSDVERLFSKNQKNSSDHTDLNELGERVVLDEITGDIIGGETYYGWSRGFCEKMKQRKRKNAKDSHRGRSRSRSSSYSRGRSRSDSPPAFKRRRLSIDSNDRSRSRSRHRRQSRSYSRSRSPEKHRDRSHPGRSYSRSRSPPRHRDALNRPPPPQQNQYPPASAFPPIPPPTGDFPMPPPVPVGYRGPWPPPPPPPMGGPPGAWYPNPGMPPQMMGGWPVPPPPPPQHMPPQHIPPQNHHFESGRGRGGFRGRGRGGYDRGRGGW